MAQVKLAYENVLAQNKTLWEMKQWNDSIKALQMNTIVGLDDLLVVKEQQIGNLKQQVALNRDMFELANDQIRKERKLKWIFVGTTAVMAGFLTLSLL
jgi:hypothetical protein